MQRGSNLLFLMDYRPAAGAHIWSPGPSSSCRREECFLFIFFLLFCGLRFFFPLPVGLCVFFFPPLVKSLKHFECFWTEYSSCWIAPKKNRLDVSAQFFRDGKLKHRCVRRSHLFAWAVVLCSCPSFKHLHENSQKQNKQTKKTEKQKKPNCGTLRKMTEKKLLRTAVFCQIVLIYIDRLLWTFEINLHFAQILSRLVSF